eukprot:gene13569-4457_t
MGGTKHDDMDGYVGSISEPATALVCPRHGQSHLEFCCPLNRGNNEQSGGNVAEGQSKVQGHVRSNKARNGRRLPFRVHVEPEI